MAPPHFTIEARELSPHLHDMIPALALLLIVVVYRVVLGMAGSADLQWLHNFAPVAAIALCGAVYLPRKFAFIQPLGMLAVSDVILNVFHYHQPLLTWEILPRYAALALITGLGLALRGRAGLARLLMGSAVGSIVFYLVTNTGSWLGDPGYAKTAAGWIQAMTTGLPGFPPTWWFYRPTFLSDLLFTVLFVACVRLTTRESAAPQPAQPQPAIPA